MCNSQYFKFDKNGIINMGGVEGQGHSLMFNKVSTHSPIEYNLRMTAEDLSGNAVPTIINKDAVKQFYNNLNKYIPKGSYFTGDAPGITTELSVISSLKNKDYKTALNLAKSRPVSTSVSTGGSAAKPNGLSVDSYESFIKMGNRPEWKLSFNGSTTKFNNAGVKNEKYYNAIERVSNMSPGIKQLNLDKIINPWVNKFGGPNIKLNNSNELVIPHPWLQRK